MLIPKRHSLAEANQLVPFLEVSFAEIERQVARVQQARVAMERTDCEPAEALRVGADIDEAELAIEAEVHALLHMGVLVPSVAPPEAHVLSSRGASSVVLSWRPGETEFLHWHSLEGEFGEWAPIDDPHLFGDPLLPC